MADQGRWFKLWTTAPYDSELGSLSLEDFARWCLFGTYLKTHGTDGVVLLSNPSLPVCQLLRVDSFNQLLSVLHIFPNCSVTPVTAVSVTYKIEWANWSKYQGDFSGDRVKRWRENHVPPVTAKKRREETRREEKRNTPIVPVGDFERFWIAYPKKLGKDPARKAWEKLLPQNGLVEIILSSVEAHKMTPDWQKDHGQFIPYPATFLNGRRWEDVLTPGASTPPVVRDPRTTWKTREKYQAGLKAGAVHPTERIPEWEPSTT
jgi:hypothetical protein